MYPFCHYKLFIKEDNVMSCFYRCSESDSYFELNKTYDFIELGALISNDGEFN